MWRSIKFCASVFSCLAEEENNRNLCAVSPLQSPHHSLLSFANPAVTFFLPSPWQLSAFLHSLSALNEKSKSDGTNDMPRLSGVSRKRGCSIVDSAATNTTLVSATWNQITYGAVLFKAYLRTERCCELQQQIYQANNGPNFCTMCFQSIFS